MISSIHLLCELQREAVLGLANFGFYLLQICYQLFACLFVYLFFCFFIYIVMIPF